MRSTIDGTHHQPTQDGSSTATHSKNKNISSNSRLQTAPAILRDLWMRTCSILWSRPTSKQHYTFRLKWRDMLSDCLLYRYAKKCTTKIFQNRKLNSNIKNRKHISKAMTKVDTVTLTWKKHKEGNFKKSPTNEQNTKPYQNTITLCSLGKISNRFFVCSHPLGDKCRRTHSTTLRR